jgi:hypothetical protein
MIEISRINKSVLNPQHTQRLRRLRRLSMLRMLRMVIEGMNRIKIRITMTKSQGVQKDPEILGTTKDHQIANLQKVQRTVQGVLAVQVATVLVAVGLAYLYLALIMSVIHDHRF